MFKLISSLLFLSTLQTYASTCDLELYSKVYRFDGASNLTARDVVKKSNCPPSVLYKVSSTISNAEGVIGSDFIKNEISKEINGIDVNFTNSKISLIPFTETLKEQITADSNLYFTHVRSLNGLSSIGLSEDEQLVATCDNCKGYGDKNLKINVTSGVNNTHKTLWFSAKILTKIRALKAARTVSFQKKSLEESDFYLEETFTNDPDNLVTSLDNIHFYKTNKTIIQGNTVSRQDIHPINLVNYGTPVNVILQNSNISIKKTAMPNRAARFGESVELRSNNKNIIGKVVDFNKVVIEL